MSTKANPKVVGAFVVGAVVLAVAAILAFGSFQFFKQTVPLVMFFQGSVGGLPAGVQIGQVTRIGVIYDPEKQEVSIPVFVEYTRGIVSVGTERAKFLDNLKKLIDDGLRAQLVSESMVTGQQSVQLSFFNPKKNPVHLTGLEPKYIEIPTVPSSIDRLKVNITTFLTNLNKVPLDELAAKIDTVLTTVNQTLTDADVLVKHVDTAVKPTLDEVQQAVADARGVLKNADGLVLEATDRLALKPGEPLQKVNETLDTYRGLGQDLRGQVGPIGAEAQAMLKKLTSTLDQAYALVDTLQRDVARNPALLSEVTQTLREFKSTAISIRALADFVRNNPNALLTGKH